MAESSHKGFVRLALMAAVIVWVLIAVGGVVRVTESGMGCADDWPLCEGSVVPAARMDAVIEYTHRIVAALASLLLLLTAIGAWRQYRGTRRVVIPAAAALVLVFVEALLGAVVVWLELPPEPVVMHLAVAFTILALAIVTAVVARYQQQVDRSVMSDGGLSGLLWLTVPALFLLLLSGGLVTGSGAAAACGQNFPLCAGRLIPERGFGQQQIHMLHRLMVLVLTVLVILVVVYAHRGQRPRVVRVWAWVAAAAFAAQATVGITQVVFGLPVALRAAHVALAAAAWGALVVLATLAGLHRPAAQQGAQG